MKKALFVYNPLSGNRNVPKELDYIVSRFIGNGTLPVPFRLDRDNSPELEMILKEEDFDYVVVSGGDGTVNSIASILLDNNIDIPVGVIPAGTCNDFARSLNIPTDMKKCLDIVFSGNVMVIDTGLINGEKYCLNTCAGGNFVDVSYSTDSELKKRFGPLAYYLTALGELANLKPVRLKLTTDEEVVEGEFLLFLILNGRHAAGFWNLVEEADLSDGCMDILLVRNCLHVEMAALFFKVLHNDFVNDRNVMWLRTSKCRIEGDSDFNLSIDGEEWKGLPIDIEFLHRRLKVFAPVK
ncbi:MAG: YegS/Rv2252/BmrU family lipid kinase [Clostridiaceae bacterium]|jgi:diacylglycerol kinase (ATP)|nr:YegS/Rv2252/BmrU family lipid kinase [Clostridiaceae bacterium]